MKAKLQSFLFCLSMLFLSVGLLQSARADDAKSTFIATEQINKLDSQVSQARILLQTGKAPLALSQLRAAAADSWKVLFSVSEKQNFLTSTDPIPTHGVISRVAREAANAHYWWGMAAQQLHSPDEAITAFARAARLCPGNSTSLNLLSDNIQAALRQSLQNGLPYSAAPDVLVNIATFTDNSEWQITSNLYEIANPIASSESTFFIYTDGNLKAPSSSSKTAPLYRNIPSSQLPAELNSTQILYIYNIPASNYYSGLATLQIKIRFSDPKDRTFAAKLGQMMLRAKMINDNFLQRKPTVLTLWLESVAANWPNPVTDESNWEAAAKVDSEPNSIMVFRMHEPRTDTEWMREFMHEYGHVAWPNFKTFAPPIEPNANGILSETMTPLWLAENVAADAEDKKLVYPLIEQTALPVLRFWLNQDPNSPIATGDNEQARSYLQGICVYLDRVYGSKVLSYILTKIKNGNNTAKDILNIVPESVTEVSSIYLPAAVMNMPIDVTSLINKSSVSYANSDIEFRIYIPAGTTKIQIPWMGDGTMSNKSTFGTTVTNQQNLTLDINGNSGWQKLHLRIEGKVLLKDATFLKNEG